MTTDDQPDETNYPSHVAQRTHMPHPLLTIVVPTYNRSENLDLLLRTLREETALLTDDIVIFVSDNASQDNTQAVITAASEGWPALVSSRHPYNVGPDENFCHCVRTLKTRWFWILGDDDLPKRGMVAKVLTLLREREPALLYMHSEWLKSVQSPDQGEAVGSLNVHDVDALTFAKVLHTWVTFISGLVIDRERLETALQGQAIDRFNATSLVQLGWVLPLCKTHGPFLIIKDRCILATSGNTGGYRVLTTFCINFPEIVSEFFQDSPQFRDAILNRHIKHYLPSLIWKARFSNIGKFLPEDSNSDLKQPLSEYLLFRILIWPIMTQPRLLAWPFYIVARALARFSRTTY